MRAKVHVLTSLSGCKEDFLETKLVKDPRADVNLLVAHFRGSDRSRRADNQDEEIAVRPTLMTRLKLKVQ